MPINARAAVSAVTRTCVHLAAVAFTSVLALDGLAGARAVATSSITLWAWERPEDLRFVDGRSEVEVAFLAATISLDRRPRAYRRAQPLRVGPNTRLIAVVRIERAHELGLEGADAERALVLKEVRHAASLPRVRGVQIDFDARGSERAHYVRMLREIRAVLPGAQTLSMTALASWCFFDDWITAARPPVDDVAMMAFSMGPEGPSILGRLREEGVRARACRRSLGVATYEPWPRAGDVERVFAFSDRPWTAEALARIEAEMRR